MNIVKFNGEEYDLKAARGKAVPVITVTQEQISDIEVEIIGEYQLRDDEMPIVVPHEGQYVFFTGRPAVDQKEIKAKLLKAKLLTKYNLKKAKLNDVEVVERAEQEHAKTKQVQTAKTFSKPWKTRSEN